MSTVWKFVSAIALLGSVAGCNAERASSDAGRLDVVIQPDSALASSLSLRGNFTLRSLERGNRERISVEQPSQTLSVSLRAGAYVLEWQPTLRFEAEAATEGEMAAFAAGAALVLPVVVAAGQVTTLNVRATVGSSDPDELARASAALPSVEIAIARH